MFQNEVSKDCFLFIPFSKGHRGAAYLSFLVYFSLYLSVTYFRKHFLRKMWPIHSGFFLFIVCKIFLSSLALYNTSFLAQSIHLSPAPHFKTFQVYQITIRSVQCSAPYNLCPKYNNSLAVNTSTPKSCHSKQQHITAHKLHSCNQFILHSYNIIPSVPTVHNIQVLIPSAPTNHHVTHSVQLTQSVKATDSASCI